jgi:hypothetical protein
MKALDLFCGIGGVCRGLQRRGYTVVGVDADGSKADHYPGEFIEHDLTTGLPDQVRGETFDIAWASPPCHFAMDLQYARKGRNLIPVARDLLDGVDARHTVIENVVGAADHLESPTRLCGCGFDEAGVHKARVFETSFPAWGTACRRGRINWDHALMDREHPVESYRDAHGFDASDQRLTAKGLREAIPAYYVGRLLDQAAKYGAPGRQPATATMD